MRSVMYEMDAKERALIRRANRAENKDSPAQYDKYGRPLTAKRAAIEKLAAMAAKDDKPTWFPKAILGGTLLGAAHGAARPHSAFSGGIERVSKRHSAKQRLAAALVGSTVGAGLGWLPQIVYEGTR